MKKKANVKKRICLFISKEELNAARQESLVTAFGSEPKAKAADYAFLKLKASGVKNQKVILDLIEPGVEEVLIVACGKFTKSAVRDELPDLISKVREARLDVDFHFAGKL